jgi:hypothetical protein
MSGKTQKHWRELCRDLHNEQESGNLMDILRELNGAMEQRVVEMTPPEGFSASLARFDPVAQVLRSAAIDKTKC